MLRVFYCCYSTGDEVPSFEAVAIDRESALGIAQMMLREPKDYVGFTDENGITLQFMVEKDGSVWVEVPAPREDGSYGKSVTMTVAEAVIASLPTEFGKGCIPGLAFRSWF